jgi:hypothetical protein
VIERHPAHYDFHSRFLTPPRILAAECACVYVAELAEGYAVISDESMLADMIGEDLDAVTIRLFPTEAARDAFAAQLTKTHE